MDANVYQARTKLTAKYPGFGTGSDQALGYVAMGLAGETGEVVECVKKLWRGDKNADELRERLRKELGDVLWYAARVADEMGMTLAEVMQLNLDKLADRNARGVIKGSGDER